MRLSRDLQAQERAERRLRRSPQLTVVAAAGGTQRVGGHPLLHVLQVAAVRAALAPCVQTPDHLSHVTREMHWQLAGPRWAPVIYFGAQRGARVFLRIYLLQTTYRTHTNKITQVAIVNNRR